MNNKGFVNIAVVIGLIIVAGVAGYFLLIKKSSPVVPQPSLATFTSQLPTSTPPTTTPAKTPAPKLPTTISFQETGDGCGNIFVYKINSTDTAGISVSASKEKLNLSTTDKNFEVGKTDGLKVEILAGEKIRQLYCNDVSYLDQPKPKKLIGKSGQAIISISKVDESQPEWNRNYTATVILKDIHFTEENGNDSDITIGELIFKDISVGWLPG